MNKTSFALTFVLALAGTAIQVGMPAEASAESARLTAPQIVEKVAESDPWGMGGAEVNAKATVMEKTGKTTRALVFDAKSRRANASPLSKSVISFSAPADVAGTKYLQIQNADTDDERFYYTPEQKRSRRIAGSNRADAFMGTDFSYADLDRRDLRNSTSVMKADETVSKFDCYHVTVTPTNADAVYGRIDLWVRKDNHVPLKWAMYDKGNTKGDPVKTLLTKEIRRKDGKWFITASKMTSEATGRQTDLVLETINRRDDIPLENFSVRAMEKS